LAWLSSLSGGAVTPTADARRAVKLWSLCRDSYDSMNRHPPKSASSHTVTRCCGTPLPAHATG